MTCSSSCLDHNLPYEAQVTSENAVSLVVYAFCMQHLFSICDVLGGMTIKKREKSPSLSSSTCWLQMIRVMMEEPMKENKCPCPASQYRASWFSNLLTMWDLHIRIKTLWTLKKLGGILTEAGSQIAYIRLLTVRESRTRRVAQCLRVCFALQEDSKSVSITHIRHLTMVCNSTSRVCQH